MYPKSIFVTDFETFYPFIGLRQLIKNPRLRCWGNIMFLMACKFINIMFSKPLL